MSRFDKITFFSKKYKEFFILLVISFLSGCSSNEKFSLTFYGGAEEIGGSCALLSYKDKNILIDCGSYIFQEGAEVETENNYIEETILNDFIFNPENIDALILTHAHVDHCGKLPLLYEKGFKGITYITKTTGVLLPTVLQNIIRYDNRPRFWVFSSKVYKKFSIVAHWNNCDFSAKIKYKYYFNGTFNELKQKIPIPISPCKACANLEILKFIKYFRTVEYYQKFYITNEIKTEAIPIYHIPGAASFLLTLYERSNDKTDSTTLIFSGDIGNDIRLIYDYYKPYPRVDYIVVEGTYGNKIRERNYEIQLKQFLNDISENLKRNYIVWIPSFALDRTQKILHTINYAKQIGIIDKDVPVYVPSPTANTFNELYYNLQSSGDFSENFNPQLLKGYYNFLPDLNSINGRCILITTSGMLNTSYSEMLLPILVPRADVFLCFVGFQAEKTPGWQIIQKYQYIQHNNQKIPVKLQWKKYDLFSGHGDAKDILYLLSNNKNSIIILNHGEKETLRKLKKFLLNNGFKKVIIAHKMKKYKYCF